MPLKMTVEENTLKNYKLLGFINTLCIALLVSMKEEHPSYKYIFSYITIFLLKNYQLKRIMKKSWI